MRKCNIITYIEAGASELLKDLDKESYIICADGGLKYALDEGISPDLVIADFDSYSGDVPDDINVIQVPSEKDDTDTGLCITYAIENGFTDIVIYGGIGGRLDHTVANLQNMLRAKEAGMNIVMKGPGNEVHILENESKAFKPQYSYISVFAHGTAKGVSEKGTYYELDNGTLSSSFPLGVSNEISDDEAVISVTDGIIFVILSSDRT